MTDQTKAPPAPASSGLVAWIRNLDYRWVTAAFAGMTTIEMLIASGQISLDGALPAAWVPVIVKWCGILVIVNQVLNIGHITTAAKWPAAVPAAAKALALFVLASGMLVIAQPAFAQGGVGCAACAPYPAASPASSIARPTVRVRRAARAPLPRPRPSEAAIPPRAVYTAATTVPATLTAAQVQQNPLLLLQNVATSDLQAALADANAQTPADTVAAQCYQALLNLKTNPAFALPPGNVVGAFTAIQKGRDLKTQLANLASPTGPLANLNAACAAWTQDNVTTLIAVGGAAGLIANPAGATAAATGALAAFNAQVLAFLATLK